MSTTPIPFPEPRRPRRPSPKAQPGGERPQLFTIRYTTARILKERSNEQHELWGCRFPCGSIALENLVVFERMAELEAHFERAGQYTIEWIDE